MSKPTLYTCKTCGTRVHVGQDGQIIRACGHDGAGVLADISATATRGHGGLSVAPPRVK